MLAFTMAAVQHFHSKIRQGAISLPYSVLYDIVIISAVLAAISAGIFAAVLAVILAVVLAIVLAAVLAVVLTIILAVVSCAVVHIIAVLRHLKYLLKWFSFTTPLVWHRFSKTIRQT